MWRCMNDVEKLDAVTAERLNGAGLRQSAHTGLNIRLMRRGRLGGRRKESHSELN